ncbi:glycosyltransferase family 2 protein [Francisella salina]|uniref:Glycosyltransferase n=1 Tax=Francisella salina TaxID=573569 RepID=A0ABN3ZRG2_FRAST|nr:glycosyltransferase family A protein [Francisella salina]AEI35694.1 glycosyltransferase [Francisella salina]
MYKGVDTNSLLKNAQYLRSLDFLESHHRLISELVLECFNKMTNDQKKFISNQIVDVLRRTQDREIIDSLLKNDLEFFQSLDLSPNFKSKYIEVDISIDNYGIDKHLLYDFYNTPAEIINKLVRESSFDKIFKNIDYMLILANDSLIKQNQQMYLKYFNKYLESYDLYLVDKVSLSDSNILQNIGFNSKPSPTIKEKLSKVSIIMSAFNSADTIVYAIKSLLVQTYTNFEILICDDCSSDDTLSIAKELAAKDARIKVFRSKANQGTYNIRNALIEYATGDYITFHDSDDFALPTRIEFQVAKMQNPKVKVCYTRLLRIDEQGSFVFFFDGEVSRFCASSMMVRKSIFRELSKFRSSSVSADTEYFKLIQHYYGNLAISIIDKPLVLALWSRGSLTQQNGLVADNSGFVSQKRRAYAEITAQQRIFGKDIVLDAQVNALLQNCGIYREYTDLIEL